MSVQVEETAGLNRWQRYLAYRDSGVDWLGEIPAHWDVKRLKSLGDIRPSNIDKKTVDDQHPVKLCNYTDVYYRDLITEDIEFMEATATPEQIRRFELRAGDVIITKDSESADDIAVAAFVPRDLPGVVCGYHLAVIRPISKIDGRYLFRAFAAMPLSGQFEISARGITRYGLSYAAIADALMLVPPLSEQRAIAAFLDRKTGEIDALIAKKRELIARLQEQRSAISSHAVTRGLNPDAPMKDSGIEWLGEIPAHWEVVRFRRVVLHIEQGWSPLAENRPADEGEWGVLKVGCVNYGVFNPNENKALLPDTEPLKQYEIKYGDLLISRANTRELLGSAAVVKTDRANLLLCDKLYRVDLRDGLITSAFASFALASRNARHQIEREATGASPSMQNIGQEAILEIVMPLPPYMEQDQIIEYIESVSGQIHSLIAKAEETITRLQEYRAALISAAVTGRIDVREEV